MAKQLKPWMYKIATIHAMNEAATKNIDAKSILESWGNMHMNPDANFAGIGDPTLPNGTMNPDGSFTGDPAKGFIGSGDMPSSTLPMAMAIAANTIALELLPTVPISTSLTLLPYVNGVYSGGATNRNIGSLDYSRKNPRLFKVIVDWDATVEAAGKTKKEIIDAIRDAFKKKDGAGIELDIEGVKAMFTGMLSFYDKGLICEVVYPSEAYRNGNTYPGGEDHQRPAADANNVFNAVKEALVEGDVTVDVDDITLTVACVDTVKTYEDFVPFFTGVSKYSGKSRNGYYANGEGADGAPYDLKSLNPYLRSEAEVTPANKVSLEMASTKVDAKSVKIEGVITREMFQDMTSYGYDPYGFLNAILINECTQRINFDILKALHVLGRKHADQIDFKANIVAGGDLLHENTLTIQKQIVAKFNLASNIISTRSRVSPADWAVVSAGIGTALMDMPTFLAAPATTFAAASGSNSVYCIGNLGRLKIYVDPYLDFDSTSCLVGAVGTEQSPGLKFMPYILADQVTYPSEGMGGQNVVSMNSRYAIAPAGMHPETMYLGFDLTLVQADGEDGIKAVFPYLG